MIMATEETTPHTTPTPAVTLTPAAQSRFVTRIRVNASDGADDVFETLCENVISKSQLSIAESAKALAIDHSGERETLRDDSSRLEISLDSSAIVCHDVSFSEFCMNPKTSEGDADSAHGSSIDTATTASTITTAASNSVKELLEPSDADLLEDDDIDEDEEDTTQTFADLVLDKCRDGTEEYKNSFLSPPKNASSYERRYNSTSEMTAMPTISADRSPSSQSVKSMSAISPMGKARQAKKSSFSSSWLVGFRKKRSLTALFDNSKLHK